MNTIDKQHFISLFSLIREKAFTLKNIKVDFAASDLFSFNLNRILKSMSKFLANINVSKVNKVKMRSCSQNVVLQTSVTSVLVESFMSLQNLIIKQNTYTLDNTSKQKLKRHVLKLIKAD